MLPEYDMTSHQLPIGPTSQPWPERYGRLRSWLLLLSLLPEPQKLTVAAKSMFRGGRLVSVVPKNALVSP